MNLWAFRPVQDYVLCSSFWTVLLSSWHFYRKDCGSYGPRPYLLLPLHRSLQQQLCAICFYHFCDDAVLALSDIRHTLACNLLA